MFCKYQCKDIIERSSIVLISLMLYLAAISKCEIKCIQRSSQRSSHRKSSERKGVLRNFAKFTGKHLCQGLFLIKFQAQILQNSQKNTCARMSLLTKLQDEACNFIKKETLAQVFSREFCENSENTFFTEHLRATVSGYTQKEIPKLFWKVLQFCSKTCALDFLFNLQPTAFNFG